MGFTPAFTSTWDSKLLNEMLNQLRAERDLVDVTMVTEDTNAQADSKLEVMEVEETIEIDSTIEDVIKMDSTNGDISDTTKEEGYKMFENTVVIEDTIEIEETFNDTTEEKEDSNYSEEESGSENNESQKYFAGCPVHNHHTDSQSMCPDDPPCVCLGEVE